METGLSWNSVDIAVAIILAIGLIQGLRRGLSGEIARLAGMTAAVWLGWHYYHPVGLYLLNSTRMDEREAMAAAFFVCLAGVFLLCFILRLILARFMQVTFKGPVLERAGGAVAGVLRTALLAAAIVFFMGLLPSAFIRENVVEKSLFGRAVNDHAPRIWRAVRSCFPSLPELPEGAAALARDESSGGEHDSEEPLGEIIQYEEEPPIESEPLP